MVVVAFQSLGSGVVVEVEVQSDLQGEVEVVIGFRVQVRV